MATNYIISIHGRGATHAFLAAAETDEHMADRCMPALNAGFEVFVFRIEPSQHGPEFTPFAPTGSTHLRRVYHLHDAHEDFADEARSIINRLEEHSEAAAAVYVTEVIQVLMEEAKRLNASISDRQLKETTSEQRSNPEPGQVS